MPNSSVLFTVIIAENRFKRFRTSQNSQPALMRNTDQHNILDRTLNYSEDTQGSNEAHYDKSGSHNNVIKY